MKKPLPKISNPFPPYHRVTIFIDYIKYLYENIPEESSLILKENMQQVHQVYWDAYNKLINTVSNFTGIDDDSDVFYEALPLKELYAVSHRYNNDIVDFEAFRKNCYSREVVVNQILSDLE